MVTRQPFEYNFFLKSLTLATLAGTSAGFPFTYEDGVDIATMGYSGTGPFEGWCRRSTSSSRRRPESPTGLPTPAARPLTSLASPETSRCLQRGTCDFSVKIANAVAAGAEAVIIFNEGNIPERSEVGFGQAPFPQDVPVLEMSAADGAALVDVHSQRAGGWP